MMAQKNLQELLQEDQEAFLLKDYIETKRSQLKRPSTKTQLQVKKRKPISENSHLPANFCKNACFFSFSDSPDLRKSPLFEFQSPAKSPCKSPNRIFLHIPARTAALLLEASLRIQKQKTKTTQNKNLGFGLFGSFLKKLTLKSRTRKREIEGDGVKVSLKNIINGSQIAHQKTEVVENKQCVSKITPCETSFSCPCTGTPSSAIWSESNEEKSSDLETSCSSQSQDSEAIEFITKLREGVEYDCCVDNGFCQSPFHFVLQRSPSPGRRTPEFSSPVVSPSRHKKEEQKNYDIESLKKIHGEAEDEEEEKDQCSPVSVLDPPFEDDDDGRDHENGGGFDLESSYAIVQRTKLQLLQKLRRFEKLAELDPIELDKRMEEQDDEEEDDGDSYKIDNMEEEEEEEEFEKYESRISVCEANEDDSFIIEVLRESNAQGIERIPENMKTLVSDLILEEGRHLITTDNREVVKRVWKRLESWKKVESNTIDMMVAQDMNELDGWKNNQEQVGETAMEIEFAIYGLLVEELAAELACPSGI